jgi:chromosome segregation ATPase
MTCPTLCQAAHEETLAMASEQMEAVRQERDELRRRVGGLDAELGRRQERIYELQDSVVQLQQQGKAGDTAAQGREGEVLKAWDGYLHRCIDNAFLPRAV